MILIMVVQGATALHIACQTSNADVVEELLGFGAPVLFDTSSACKVVSLHCPGVNNEG